MKGKAAIAGQAVFAFWAWWSDQLCSILPERWRGGATERNRLDLFILPEETLVESVDNGSGRKLREAYALENLPAESWKQVAALSDVRKARLFLGEHDLLVVPVKLPRVGGGQIRSALELQLPSLVPLDPYLLEWDFIELSRDAAHIQLVLVMAKCARLDVLESLFAQHDLMPPAFCVRLEGKVLTLRRPLEISHKPLEERKMQFAILIAAMLAMIPALTIGGAKMMTSIENDRAESLRQELAPRFAVEKTIAREEMIRRAASPLLNMPSASNRLESLARSLPETDWTVSAAQQPDGSFEFVADMRDREKAESALKQIPILSRLELAEELESESLRSRIRYRTSR
ncbi:hypothetical protein [Parasphingorhabdus sp.]|uniref:hypothetical protein n=1 Tax=Parasphingorhabdus sp. TaxID=2709688 RepID=UPI0032651D05